MRLKNEDTHHLRSDLSQDPSISMSGNGTGYDLLAGVNFQITDNIRIQLGYQLWQRYVRNQSIVFISNSGGTTSYNLMDLKSRRHGLFAQLVIPIQ